MVLARPWKEYGRYGSVGLELILSIGVGYWIGKYVDHRFFHDAGWATGIGFLLGVYTGFRALVKVAQRMQKDIKDAEKREQGEDPWADEQEARDAPPKRAPPVDEKNPDEKNSDA